MPTIKVLGTGCKNCTLTAKLFEEAAAEAGLALDVEKVTDLAQIMGYGALSTPGVVIDEQLVHSGGVPSRDQVKAWLAKL